MNRVNSCNDFGNGNDDSTINIVMAIIIITKELPVITGTRTRILVRILGTQEYSLAAELHLTITKVDVVERVSFNSQLAFGSISQSDRCIVLGAMLGGSVAEWLACWTQAQKGRTQVQIAVATLSGNSLRQTVHTDCASRSSKIGSSPLKGCGGNCRPGGK